MDCRFSAGELATSNFYQLQKVSKVLSACISRQEVEKQYQDMLRIEEQNHVIQRDLDRMYKVADELNTSHSLLNQRVGALDAMVSTKIDRSELAHLQALAAKVALYDDFRLDTLDSLKQLTAHSITTDQRLSQQEAALETHVLRLDDLSGALPKLATKKDVHALARELRTHGELIAARATQVDHDAVKALLEDAQQLVEQHGRQLVASQESIASLSAGLQTKASVEQMQARLPAVEFEKFHKEVDSLLRSKTPLIVTDALEARAKVSTLSLPVLSSCGQRFRASHPYPVICFALFIYLFFFIFIFVLWQYLEEAVVAESKRTDVAVRFVEWFMSRGEHYEHNLQIIDKHLKDLVVSERSPRVHTYYLPGNRVELAAYKAPAFPAPTAAVSSLAKEPSDLHA